MFLPLAIAALTAVAAPTVSKTTVKDVKVGIRHGKVSFHIKGSQPISMKKVTAHNGDKAMIIWVRDAVLGQKDKVFKHRDVTIKAHQHKSSVELDVIYKKNLHCEGNITLKTSTRGIRALTQCDKQPKALVAAFTKENIQKRRHTAKQLATQKLQATKVETVAAVPPPEAEDVSPLSLAAVEAHTTQVETEKEASSGYAALFVPVFLLIGVAAFGLWIRKKKPNLIKPSSLHITHNTALGPKSSLMIAEVAGHKLLLASSEQGIQLLKDLESPRTQAEEEEIDDIVHELVNPVEQAPVKAKVDLKDIDSTEQAQPWVNSGLQQTPSLALVNKKVFEPAFEQVLSDSETAEDDILRRKIQNSRDLYLA
jgi:flagellar biogenesis protein FliO